MRYLAPRLVSVILGCLIATGGIVRAEFPVNTYTTGAQRSPAVAADAAGNFVVVWSSYGQDGSGSGVFGQRYDSDGNPLGSEFPVNTFTTSAQSLPEVAMGPAGSFVVVWQSDGQDGSSYGVFGQRYDATGMLVGGEFQVNTTTADSQRNPTVAVDAPGNFVVGWRNEEVVTAQRFDAAGVAQGGELVLASASAPNRNSLRTSCSTASATCCSYGPTTTISPTMRM